MKAYTPQFTDPCEHSRGSFIRRAKTRDGTAVDLYVYPTTFGAELCLRYGNEPHEYQSPGEVGRYLLRHRDHIDEDVRYALDDLMRSGRLKIQTTIEPDKWED